MHSRPSWRAVALGLGVAAAAASLSAPAAAQETVLTATGGQGDRAYNDNCAPGEYMVGMKGGHGAWVDRVGIICMPMTSRGVLSGPVKFDHPEFGGPGGGIFNKRCRPNYFIGGFSGNLTEGPRRVQVLRLTCVSKDEATWPRYVLVAGSEAMPGPTFGADCPPGQIGSGLHGRSGKDVNSVGLICRTVVVPAAAPAAPPPAPAKPIKHTGRAPVQPPPAAPEAAQVRAIDDVDVYDGPGGEFNVIGMMAQGATARQLEHREGWCKLSGVAAGADGWVADDHLSGCR